MKTFTEEQRNEFEKVARPVMKFLSNPKVFHPYVKVIIENGRAELVEGIVSFVTEDYILD
jgi:hypothetical protein